MQRLSTSFALLLSAGAIACVKIVPSPFEIADASSEVVQPADAGSEEEQEVDGLSGKVCAYVEDCDDQIPCTFDACDPNTKRCTHAPDDTLCQNGRFCDGIEVCDVKEGCSEGVPKTCSDQEACTIDRCNEETKLCDHALRDADGDGDPDYHCNGGGDCNDLDSTINSKSPEICNDKKDNNCDGTVDEQACTSAQNDTCSDPALLTSGATVTIKSAGAKLDYGASCVPPASPSLRDVVGALAVPAGSPKDLDVIAKVAQGTVYTAIAEQCADPSTEIACALGMVMPTGGMVARLLARDVSPGNRPIYVWSDTYQDILLTATLRDAATKPTNETCGTALPIAPNTQITAEILDCARDVDSECISSAGDLVYSFTLTSPKDVRVFASSTDGIGNPIISLRSSECVSKSSELACKTGSAPVVFVRALPAGTYYVDVSATAPTVVQFNVLLSDPTAAPADDQCATAPALEPNKTIAVSLLDHLDDIKSTCQQAAPDAVYSLTVAEPSDVLLVARIPQGDTGGPSLMDANCTAAGLLSCAVSSPSPVRTAVHNVPAGTYKVVVETTKGDSAGLTAFLRPAQASVYLPFAETCSDAQLIGPSGGFFSGNTSNALAHYDAGCDQAGMAGGGAPDQMLKLTLSAQKRVVFDMRGSDYQTLLNVRRGPSCPGEEIVGGCAVGYYTQRSYVDLTLEPGEYWVQVDGHAGYSGQWYLDVFLADP